MQWGRGRGRIGGRRGGGMEGKDMVCGILLVVMNYVREELKSVSGIHTYIQSTSQFTFNLHLDTSQLFNSIQTKSQFSLTSFKLHPLYLNTF